MTMKIYYAHPMSWYNTPGEARDLKTIERYGTVINPNTLSFQDAVRLAKTENRPGMEIFAETIRKSSDAVAFRPFRDGKMGAGVAREVFEAVIWNRFIFEVTDKGLEEVDPTAIDFGSILTVEQTRRRIKDGVL